MANLTIFDTGYPNIDNNGDQESSANRVNSGTAMTLKIESIDYERAGNIDNSPVIGRFYSDFTTKLSPTIINLASVEVPKIRMSGVLDRKTSADMDLIVQLDKLCTTRGMKLLYYSSTTDGYRDLTDTLGTTDSVHTTQLGSSITHLHVIFTTFRISQTPTSNLMRFTLTCEVTV